MKKYVTSYINDIHLSNNSTIGNNDLGKALGSPLNPSINLSSAYAFKTVDELNEYHNNKRDNTRYARDGNELTRQTEEYFGHIFDNSTSFLFNYRLFINMAYKFMFVFTIIIITFIINSIYRFENVIYLVVLARYRITFT